MDPLTASSLIVAVAFTFTFASSFRFYRRRAIQTPVDKRSALRPTLIISLSFLVGAISTLLSFYSILNLPPPPTVFPPPSIDVISPFELVAEFATPLFGFTLLVAVVSALKRNRLYALPVSLLAASYLLTLLSPKHPLDDPYLSMWFAVGSLMLFLPMILFGYLWRTTKRPTALGMFVGILIYLFYYIYYARTMSEYISYLGFYLVPAEYSRYIESYGLLSELMPLALFASVFSLSFIYWCFRYSEKKLGGEVVGYSMSFPVIATEVYILMLTLGLVPLGYMVTLIGTTIAVGVFILTGSYLYGRYRENPYKQTLTLSLFSYFAGLSYLFFNIGQHLYVFVGRFPAFDLITLPIGMITGSFLFMSAMYALDRPSLVPTPLIVVIPLILLSLFLYPMPAWLLYTMVIAAVVLTLVPGTLFGILWRRMSKGKEKGRGRVLGIFMGFLLILLASPVQTLSASVADPIAFVASLIAVGGSFVAFLGALFFYLGISGRFDRWFYERRV